jgi:hypothetical protein
MNQKLCSELGAEHIFFNVHKIYQSLNAFTFQSTLLIKCGTMFQLKIEQTLQAEYDYQHNKLTGEAFKQIIEQLYADSEKALQEHIERNRTMGPNNIPKITATSNVFSNYLSSINYTDLYRACFPV